MSPTRRDFLQSSLAAAVLLRRPELSPPTHLDVARKAERWIRTTRIPTGHGVQWPADPLKPERSSPELYNGYSGVVLFYLELFRATGDRQFLGEAVGGARQLASTLPNAPEDVREAGLYTGIAGIGFVIGEVARASGDKQLETAAQHALQLVKASAKPTGKGIQWTESNDIISGIAGTGLYLLRSGDKGAVQLAIKAGDRLLETAEPADGGLKWGISPSVANRYPNFSHGAAGVGYFLARLHNVTRERRFADAALAAAQYLDAVANKENGGWKVFHHEPNGESLYYLSWCHGPAGTARLFHELSSITGDKGRWESLIHKGAKATVDMGVPEKQSPGYWNNISQCCGNCGVGEFFLAMNKLRPRAEYQQMVDRVAANTLERATAEGEGLKWIQAENRVSPNDVIAQTGLMQGAAGVGRFYLHGHDYSKRIPLPDDPW
jgi:lantibiotic modifying enzyme